MTGSGVMGQCYSDHEWLPVDKQYVMKVKQDNSDPFKVYGGPQPAVL